MTRIRKRALAATCVAGAGLSIITAGCGAGAVGKNAASHVSGHFGGQLTSLVAEDVDSLDPGAADGPSDERVAYVTQRPLLEYRPGVSYAGEAPDLASRMPIISANQETITVHLRSGVRFSPPVNRVVSSADVKYAIERGFAQTVSSPYAEVYFSSIVGAPAQPTKVPEPISGLQTPNPSTLVIHLKAPVAAEVAQALVLPLTAPVPESYARRFDAHDPSTYAQHEVATGPYMVANNPAGVITGYKPGISLLLVRNPNWARSTDDRPAYLNSILVKVSNATDELLAREALDGRSTAFATFGAPPDVLSGALAAHPGQFVKREGPIWYSEALNTRIPPFTNLDVRRAVVAAVDRHEIDQINGGPLAGVDQTHYLEPGVEGFSQAGGFKGPDLSFMARPRGDLTLARQYLRAAGYASGRVHATVTAYTDNSPVDVHTADFIAAQLAPLGIDVEVRTVSVTQLNTDCGIPARMPGLCPGFGDADFGDPQATLETSFDGHDIPAEENNNDSLLNDPRINAAMAKAALLPPGPARLDAWAHIDEMITADAPGIPESWNLNYFPVSSNVHGVDVAEYGLDYSRTWLR